MTDLRIPKRINPNKIVDCTVEIRFESPVPPEVVLALVYNQVHATWGAGQNTPFSDVPKQVRDLQPEIRFQPLRKWVKGDMALVAGTNMIGIGLSKFETGTAFISAVEQVLAPWPLESILGRVTRLGLRFINFFENMNIFEKSTLKVSLRDEPLGSNPTFIRTELHKGPFVCGIQVLNSGNVEQGGKKRSGSVIDLDVATRPTTAVPPQVGAIATHLHDMHEIADETFFKLLTDEYTQTLNPEYERK